MKLIVGLGNSKEDYIDSLVAKKIENHPEKGGKTIKQLAKKYKLVL